MVDMDSINLDEMIPCSCCGVVTFMTDDIKRKFTNYNGEEVTGYVCHTCSEEIDGFDCNICGIHIEFNDANFCTICAHLFPDPGWLPYYCKKCWDKVGIDNEEHNQAHKECIEEYS